MTMDRSPPTPPLSRPRTRVAMRARRLAAAAAIALAAAGAAHAQQRYWYDGEKRRALWAEPSLVADFAAGATRKDARLVPPALAKGDPLARSPVFRDRPGGEGTLRALPGGVILRLREPMSAAQREALAARHGLAPLRELGEGSGLWFAPSAPGLPSLELANRLHESGDFAAASPNWWTPRRLK
jgi:hypothetical protein